jgi:hypothetical protein
VPYTDSIPGLLAALRAAGLTRTTVVRDLRLPNEIGVHLPPADSEALTAALFAGPALLPMALTDLGLWPRGGSLTARGCSVYLTDIDGFRLAKLVRESFHLPGLLPAG